MTSMPSPNTVLTTAEHDVRRLGEMESFKFSFSSGRKVFFLLIFNFAFAQLRRKSNRIVHVS